MLKQTTKPALIVLAFVLTKFKAAYKRKGMKQSLALPAEEEGSLFRKFPTHPLMKPWAESRPASRVCRKTGRGLAPFMSKVGFTSQKGDLLRRSVGRPSQSRTARDKRGFFLQLPGYLLSALPELKGSPQPSQPRQLTG